MCVVLSEQTVPIIVISDTILHKMCVRFEGTFYVLSIIKHSFNMYDFHRCCYTEVKTMAHAHTCKRPLEMWMNEFRNKKKQQQHRRRTGIECGVVTACDTGEKVINFKWIKPASKHLIDYVGDVTRNYIVKSNKNQAFAIANILFGPSMLLDNNSNSISVCKPSIAQ